MSALLRSTLAAAFVFALSPGCSGGGSGGTGGGSTGGGSAASGGGSTATGGGSTAMGGGASSTGGGSTAAGGGAASTGGGSAGTGGGTSSTDAGTEYTMEAGQCFTFATATLGSNNGQFCGDWLGLSGANVDLETNGSNLCLLSGTYASLSDVPTDYSTCSWSSYIEGLDGLTNKGIFVRDAATATHHYRVHTRSNSPTLVFSFSTVD